MREDYSYLKFEMSSWINEDSVSMRELNKNAMRCAKKIALDLITDDSKLNKIYDVYLELYNDIAVYYGLKNLPENANDNYIAARREDFAYLKSTIRDLNSIPVFPELFGINSHKDKYTPSWYQKYVYNVICDVYGRIANLLCWDYSDLLKSLKNSSYFFEKLDDRELLLSPDLLNKYLHSVEELQKIKSALSMPEDIKCEEYTHLNEALNTLSKENKDFYEQCRNFNSHRYIFVTNLIPMYQKYAIFVINSKTSHSHTPKEVYEQIMNLPYLGTNSLSISFQKNLRSNVIILNKLRLLDESVYRRFAFYEMLRYYSRLFAVGEYTEDEKAQIIWSLKELKNKIDG